MNYYHGHYYEATMREWEQPRYCIADGCLYRPSAADQAAATAAGEVLHPTPRHAVPETDLCPVHHGRFPRILADMVQGWNDLEQSLYKSSGQGDNDRVQTSGVPDVGARWNPYAAAVRQDIIEYVEYLVKLIMRDYELPIAKTELERPRDRDLRVLIGPPRQVITRYTHGLSVDTPSKLALAAIYRHHTYWLSAYPTLGAALLEQAIELRGKMVKATQAQPVKRILTKWRCTWVLEETDLGQVLCDGQIVGIVEPDDSARETRLLCSSNPNHVVEKPATGSWLDLA